MAVPKARWSKMRSRRSRANWKVDVPNLVECPRCHSKMMQHQVCKTCGTYKGRTVLDMEKAQ